MAPSISNELSCRLSQFRPLGLTQVPTPLEPLHNLTQELGGPRIWVKREDCTGLGFGGNKLRKLDYILRDALDQGADCLVSGGVVQSNSQRQVAAAAAKLGLECHLCVYQGRVKAPSPDYYQSGNALLNRLYGAQLHDLPWTGDRNQALFDLADRLSAIGKEPFVVPYGASSALGAVGYASVVAEIADQAQQVDLYPSAIVHCSGSGGTQAGLVVGACLALPETDIVGIDIDAEPERVEADVRRYAQGAAQLLNLPFDPDRVSVLAGHAGPAYGVPHQATLEAIKLAGRLEALALDPVYSAKGLAGMIALIKENRWTADQDIIFLHTGGAPALFAYQSSLELDESQADI